MEAREAPADNSLAKPPILNRALRWGAELAILAAVYVSISAWQERNLLDTASTSPAFSLETLEGERVSLDDYRGKRVLLHFWATWCGVCRQEFAALNALHAELDADEVLLSIVADADDRPALMRFVSEHAIKYPVLLGGDVTAREFRVNAFPTNYFLDADGRVQDHTVGMSTRWGLSARLARAK